MFRKKGLAAIAFVAALAITGAAVAYFTGGSGNVTTSGTVGSPGALSVTAGTPTWSGTLTALYPGASSDTEFLPFTVKNNGNGNQAVTTITAAVLHDSSTPAIAETASGTLIPGCQAGWFTVTVDSGNPALPSDLASGSTYAGKVDLTMPDNTTTNQNACQGASPGVTITAS